MKKVAFYDNESEASFKVTIVIIVINVTIVTIVTIVTNVTIVANEKYNFQMRHFVRFSTNVITNADLWATYRIFFASLWNDSH